MYFSSAFRCQFDITVHSNFSTPLLLQTAPKTAFLPTPKIVWSKLKNVGVDAASIPAFPTYIVAEIKNARINLPGNVSTLT